MTVSKFSLALKTFAALPVLGLAEMAAPNRTHCASASASSLARTAYIDTGPIERVFLRG